LHMWPLCQPTWGILSALLQVSSCPCLSECTFRSKYQEIHSRYLIKLSRDIISRGCAELHPEPFISYTDWSVSHFPLPIAQPLFLVL
jgi:hypothetical protein